MLILTACSETEMNFNFSFKSFRVNCIGELEIEVEIIVCIFILVEFVRLLGMVVLKIQFDKSASNFDQGTETLICRNPKTISFRRN